MTRNDIKDFTKEQLHNLYIALESERKPLDSIVRHAWPTIECVKELERIESDQIIVIETYLEKFN